MTELDFVKAALAISLGRIRVFKRTHILLACMPKSGSSFLTMAISALPKMKIMSATASGLRREQEIDLHIAGRRHLFNYIAQQHIRYSPETEKLMSKAQLQPIVLVRSLADCVASLRDHIKSESHQMSMAWLLEQHSVLDDEELEALIVDLIMPWYINFYVSWKNCPHATWVTYDDLRKDPYNCIATVAHSVKLRVSEREIASAVEYAESIAPRFNKGISNRGRQISQYAQERLVRLVGYYPDSKLETIVFADSELALK